jgi:hypothetical protein
MANTKKSEMTGKGKGKKGNKESKMAVSKMTAPATQAPRITRTSGPSVKATPRGLIVSNTEYLRDVVLTGSAGAVTVNGTSFNPATSGSWITNFARSYQFYRLKKLSWRYVPFVGSNVGGLVELGLFTNYEQFISWYNLTSGGIAYLSQLGKYLAFPPWGGSGVNSYGAGGQDNLEICADVALIHQQRQWFVVDESTGSTDWAREQQVIPVSLGIQSTSPGLSGSVYAGKIYVSYEIEFCDPVHWLVPPSSLALRSVPEGDTDPKPRPPNPDEPVPSDPFPPKPRPPN